MITIYVIITIFTSTTSSISDTRNHISEVYRKVLSKFFDCTYCIYWLFKNIKFNIYIKLIYILCLFSTNIFFNLKIYTKIILKFKLKCIRFINKNENSNFFSYIFSSLMTHVGGDLIHL